MSTKLLSPFSRKNKRPGYEKGDPKKQFDLLECLGEGTYGTVWTGTEKKTGRTCAVKIVTIDDDLEEIEQEIAIMRDSESHYIVKFYGKSFYSVGLREILSFILSSCWEVLIEKNEHVVLSNFESKAREQERERERGRERRKWRRR